MAKRNSLRTLLGSVGLYFFIIGGFRVLSCVSYKDSFSSDASMAFSVLIPFTLALAVFTAIAVRSQMLREILRQNRKVTTYQVALFCIVLLSWVLTVVRDPSVSGIPLGHTMLIAVSTVLVSGVQELLCRGLVLREARKLFSTNAGVFLTTVVVFGLIHLVNLLGRESISEVFWQVMFTGIVGGTYFYAVMEWFGSIWWSIAAHAVWNFPLFLKSAAVSYGRRPLELHLSAYIVALACCLFLIVVLQRQRKSFR